MAEKTITREAAVQMLREKLIEVTAGGKQSVCRFAAEHNVLCRGFNRYTDDEFLAAYQGRVEGIGAMTRAQAEDAANRWQLDQQRVGGWTLSCDAQYALYEVCKGWDDFTNEQLGRFCRDLLGRDVEVTGKSHRPIL